MAITSYEKDGKTFWRVYLNLRSKDDPTIREQKLVQGIESEKAALAEEKRLYRELSQKLASKESQGLTWDSVLTQWELKMRSDPNQPYVTSTLFDYISCVRKWTPEWMNLPASEITKADGRVLLAKLRAEGKTKGHIKHVQGIINSIFRWAIETRLIKGVQESPVRGISLDYREEERPPEVLTIEEIKKLLRDAKSLEHPWYPVWAMALLTGMRNGELFALLWSDVDLENCRITVSKSYNTRGRVVKSTKSGKWRTVPISNELKELLVELKSHAGKRAHVLPRLTGWDEGRQAEVLRKFCQGIGIRSVRFHALRACFATQLLAHDIAPARVMKVCGWQDLKTMQYYIRLAGVDERGATDPLKILPSDEACMGEVVKIFDFKASRDNRG